MNQFWSAENEPNFWSFSIPRGPNSGAPGVTIPTQGAAAFRGPRPPFKRIVLAPAALFPRLGGHVSWPPWAFNVGPCRAYLSWPQKFGFPAFAATARPITDRNG